MCYLLKITKSVFSYVPPTEDNKFVFSYLLFAEDNKICLYLGLCAIQGGIKLFFPKEQDFSW